MKLNLPDLGDATLATLASAVRSVIEQQTRDAAAPSVGPRALSGRLPSIAALSAGATGYVRASSEDAHAARHFLSLMEAAYLVAASDGISDAERTAFAGLLASVRGGAADPRQLEAILGELDAASARDGRPKRLAELATMFDDFVAREEALGFATLVAVADGQISRKEARGLIELAEQLGFSLGELQVVLEQVGTSLKAALEASR
jgi:tellurite resistance protein